MEKEIDTKIHPVNRIYNLTEEEMEKMKGEEASIKYPTAYDRNQSSVDKHIKFLKSIGGLKDAVEITPEMKEKMAEDLERFWRETPLDQIAELS
jgi:hypothetical protein